LAPDEKRQQQFPINGEGEWKLLENVVNVYQSACPLIFFNTFFMEYQ
jgi:hypothetical protein